MIFKVSSPEGDTKRLWHAGKLLFVDLGAGAVNTQQAEHEHFSVCNIIVRYKGFFFFLKKRCSYKARAMDEGKEMRELP